MMMFPAMAMKDIVMDNMVHPLMAMITGHTESSERQGEGEDEADSESDGSEGFTRSRPSWRVVPPQEGRKEGRRDWWRGLAQVQAQPV